MNELLDGTGPINVMDMVCMPRLPRLQFEGAFYHVFTRGNRRERTFRDDADYREFEGTLLDACDRTEVHLYAWCLMPNHFHLLVETPKGNLSTLMQRMLTAYARYFNRRYQLVGHVFQGRYGAKLCDRENYLMELVRYIHLNPYRAKNRKWLLKGKDWLWSSHRYYRDGDEPMVTRPYIHSVLRRFGDRIEEARQRYAVFMADGLEYGSWEEFYSGQGRPANGHEKFQEDVPASRKVEAEFIRTQIDLEGLVKAVCEWLGVNDRGLRSSSKEQKLSRARRVIIAMAREQSIATPLELARQLNRDPSAISHLIREMEKRPEKKDLLDFVVSLKAREGSCV